MTDFIQGHFLSIFPNIESINGIKYNEIFMVPGPAVVKGFEYIIRQHKRDNLNLE